MSGYKHATITISQKEIQTSFNEADMKLRAENKKDIEKANQSQALSNAYRQLEGRQAEYEKLLANMERDIADIEADVSQDIMEQQEGYYQSLLQQIQDLSAADQENQQLLIEARQFFNEAILEEKTRNNNRFDALRQQLSVITETQAQQEEIARNGSRTALCSLDLLMITMIIKSSVHPNSIKPFKGSTLPIDNCKRGFLNHGVAICARSLFEFLEASHQSGRGNA